MVSAVGRSGGRGKFMGTNGNNWVVRGMLHHGPLLHQVFLSFFTFCPSTVALPPTLIVFAFPATLQPLLTRISIESCYFDSFAPFLHRTVQFHP